MIEELSARLLRLNTARSPTFSAILPDEDLADIHAYLQSMPKAPDPRSIPLLNP